MKKLMRLLFVLTAFITMAGLTYAQEKEMKVNKDPQMSKDAQVEDEKFVSLAEDLATDLQSRVKLRKDQVATVEKILVEYFTEVEPVSGISDSHSKMDKMGDMNAPADHMGVKTDEPTLEKMPRTADTDISGMSDSANVSGRSSDMSKTKVEGTDMSDYGKKVHVVEQPANVSGSSSTKDADALGDAFEARQRADNKIIEALDEEQKKDYAAEKSEWWSDIQDKFESA